MKIPGSIWIWAIGFTVIVGYFAGPALFRAMARSDYENLYHGIQDAKRSAGAKVDYGKRKFNSYEQDYVYGRNK